MKTVHDVVTAHPEEAAQILEAAWAIIDDVGGGNWGAQTTAWLHTTSYWRSRYNTLLDLIDVVNDAPDAAEEPVVPAYVPLTWGETYDDDYNPTYTAVSTVYTNDGGSFYYRAHPVLRYGQIFWVTCDTDGELLTDALSDGEWCSADAARDACEAENRAAFEAEHPSAGAE